MTSLRIYRSCMARNLLFDSSKRATGVHVTVNGLKPFIVSACKKVIVSSGFIHSPQLLMISGIEQRENLEKHSITVISDLPGVTQNLRNTPNVGSTVHSMNVSKNVWTRSTSSFRAATKMSLTNGSGPLSSSPGDFAGWETFPEAYTST